MGLGDLPGGIAESSAFDISDDASVVVGYGTSTNGQEAFRWTQAGGMVGLGDLPGMFFYSVAWGVSGNGGVVVGESSGANGYEAFRWTSGGGMVGLGMVPGAEHSAAYRTSTDGNVVVGYSGSSLGEQAFRWTSASGMVGLGDLPGSSFISSAIGVSGDGSVVVGQGTGTNGTEAFRWTQVAGMIGLGDLPGGVFESSAIGVSDDGNVVVGFAVSASGSEAFRWTQAGGMVGLGDLPGGGFQSAAVAASADGSIIVGDSQTDAGSEAFIWDATNGMRNLRQMLTNEYGLGPSLAGWKLVWAQAISADGKAIVGLGTNPDGNTEAWIARLPQSAGPLTRYVWQDSPSPAPPYTNWATAAHVIQDAVDAAAPGDTVLVTNGVYATGGRAVYGTMTNRVAVDKPLSLRSVNGPEVTIIQGYQVPGTTNGDGAIRCVYLTNSASLSGFTLTNGATKIVGDTTLDRRAGGVWCESTNALVTNCVIIGNAASARGAGTHSGTITHCTLTRNNLNRAAFASTLYRCMISDNTGGGVSTCILSNCTLAGNSIAGGAGGGAIESTLYNCTLSGNLVTGGFPRGGGAYDCILNNCTLSGNSINTQAGGAYGGGAYGGTLNNCTISGNSITSPQPDVAGGGAIGSTLNNCIVYFNTAANGPNHWNCTMAYSCSTPLPGGIGNVSADPQLASPSHLGAGSPCIGAGSAAYSTGTDIDGELWASPPSMGCDEFWSGSVTGYLSVAVGMTATNVAASQPVKLTALIQGRTTASTWDFGNGASATNLPHVTYYWTVPGDYAVVLRAYNESYPGGISATGIIHVGSRVVHHVSPTGANPLPPYTSWETAATSIQDAIDVAIPGNKVLVTNGVYATGARSFGFGSNRVVIASGILVESVNGPEFTTIEGYQVPGTTNGAAAIRCVYMAGGASLSGFTLTKGATWNSQLGGGVRCDSTNALITNCVITANSAAWGGAGAYYGTLNNCSLAGNSGGGARLSSLSHCTITGNSGSLGGGAFDCVLNNCTLAGNSATQNGGGAYNGTLNNCVLTNNSAWQGGGAYWAMLNDCALISNSATQGAGAYESSLTNCSLENNSAGEFGGGAVGGTLKNCTLTWNTASSGGGGASGSALKNCTLTENSAGSWGGGANGGSLVNCALIGNSASEGGGAYAATLTNCTLIGNSASQLAGGSMIGVLHNCIAYFNTAPSSPNYFQDSGGNMSVNYVINHSCATPMPTNGVANITNAPVFVNTNGWSNLRLQSNSPCINAGNNADVSGGTDLDGRPRIVGGTVDMGAYEFQGPGQSEFIGWLQQHALPTDGSADFTDTDTDGHNNWQEWKAWTVPTNAISILKLLTPQPDANGVQVRWQSVLGQGYLLERAANVGGSFTLLQSNLVGQADTTSFTDTNAVAPSPFFYRIGVQ